MSLLLEDEEHPAVKEAVGMPVRRDILFSPSLKVCGVRVQPDRDRFFNVRVLMA